MSRSPARPIDEGGAVLIMVAVGMVAFLLLLALIVDLGALRMDRRTDRLAADAAATAGVAGLDPFQGSDAEEACEIAWDYLLLNVPDEGVAPPTPSCTVFATACNPATARTISVVVGPYTFEIVQPVPDGHAFMAGQTVNPDIDGGSCQRLGVGIRRTRSYSFAPVGGLTGGESNVSAVARIGVGLGAGELVPLLLLEPIACDALYTSGQGKVTVAPFNDTPGIIVVDSDASKTSNPNRCSQNSWSIDSKGNLNGWIRAIPAPGGINSAILSYALSGQPGAGPLSSYDPGDLTSPIAFPDAWPDETEFRLFPTPFPASRRITRAPIDWRYNCRFSYPEYDLDGAGTGGVPVMGCPEAGSRPAHIDSLRGSYGDATSTAAPAGFATWTDFHVCSYQPSDPDFSVSGNWWIDCPSGLTINNGITFTGGNIAAQGEIRVFGSLSVNAGGPNDHIVYLRSGDLIKDAQATITLDHVFVYLDDGVITFGGGSGALIWRAPLLGSFEDLALWSEKREQHELGGQAGNQLEGTLFTPNADPFVLTGQSGQFQTAAQFLTRRLEVKGQGEVLMTPDPDRITLIPVRDIRLIR